MRVYSNYFNDYIKESYSMPLQAKILIVDDDQRLRTLLQYFLTEKGFDVDCAADAEQMTHKLTRSFYDLIILDWIMPGEDGLSVCKRLHAEENSPLILMLTANGSENDCIVGLLSGADDFLAKPFNTNVLLARIQAVLRRRPRVLGALPDNIGLAFEFGAYKLDYAQRCLFLNDNIINLTDTEFALLKVFSQHVGKPLSREQLSYLLKGADSPVDSRFVDTQVYRLRRLLENDPANPVYLQTVRSVGYVLVMPKQY